MIQYNGFFGCTKCYQPGSSFKTSNGGNIHVYLYEKNNPQGPERNFLLYQSDLNQSLKEGKPFRGVKGVCSLAALKYFKPIECTMIDYMHSILEDVVKRLIQYWFSPQYYKNKYSLRNHFKTIDETLKISEYHLLFLEHQKVLTTFALGRPTNYYLL